MSVSAALAIAFLVVTMFVDATPSGPKKEVSLESIFDLTSTLRKRPRTDLDPGSFQGLVQAAEGGSSQFHRGSASDGFLASTRQRHGLRHINGPVLTLQQHETTQRRIHNNLIGTRALKRSLGSTIAQYFSTVRSVKDDQGTFLG
jgi:hypothetical protein